MFVEFFMKLRKAGIPVSLHEFLALHEALAKGLAQCSLDKFYYLARCLLVKRESHYDKFDRVFLEHFKGIKAPEELVEEVLKGLEKVKELELSEEEKKLIERWSLEEVRRSFEEKLKAGDFHGHVGGNRQIGTGGTSVHGAFGYNPAGIRIGQGYSRHKSAIQVAEERRFRNYSDDVTLDVRQFQVALSKLRVLLPIGDFTEVDIDGTIEKTCKNAGELEIVWKRSRENAIKLILLMDVGGSMDPYAGLVSRLFTAAKSQFRDLKYFYFHNCIYQDLWLDAERREVFETENLFRMFDSTYRVIIVGDAAMAPSELLEVNGAIDYWYYNDTPGIVWLRKIKEHFKHAVWLNPMPRRVWDYNYTVRIIKEIFPMFELTLSGIDDAVKVLLGRDAA